MSKKTYSKPALTYLDQINLLEKRGLQIQNKPKAEHLLKNISYYRLSGYWYPLLADKKNHIFKPNASFETAFNIYKFDRELRALILAELEKIEISIRAHMIYILSQEYGAFWFQDKAIFKSETALQKSLEGIEKEYKRSDEEFIKAFQEKYSNNLPASWMILEITTFNTLSILYSNLRPGKTKREIAYQFGLNDKVFSSWIHSIVYLRNVCAHHSRFWNRSMSISPKYPKKTSHTWINHEGIENNSTYYVLSMVLYFMQIINPNHSILSRIKLLTEKYPNIDMKAMGFPKDWKKESLWQEK